MGNPALQALLARDAATMLGDFGTTVTFGTVRTTGVVDVRDEPAEVQGGAIVMQRRTVLRLVTGALALTDGSVVTVGTRAYRVEGNGTPVPPDGLHTDYTLTGAA